jgi:hypothetical protein
MSISFYPWNNSHHEVGIEDKGNREAAIVTQKLLLVFDKAASGVSGARFQGQYYLIRSRYLILLWPL